MEKNRIKITITIIGMIILASIAIFMAIRLYQLRQSSVSPNAPESKPEAAGNNTISCSALTFSISTPTPTPTSTPTLTNTPKPTPTPTITPRPTESPTPTITPTPTPSIRPTNTATPTPTRTPIAPTSVNQPTPTLEASLPDSGVSWPTMLGVGGGAIMLIISLLLAL